MRIAVVGAGALGLYYGAMLQRGGAEVAFLLRRDFEAISAHGLQVRSVDGDFHLPHVDGYRHAADIGPVDLVLIGLKTFANDRIRELIPPLLGEQTLLLTLQNGLGNEDLLAGLFGSQRVLGGVAFLCANRGEPGVVHHLGAGRIELGAWGDVPSGRIAAVAAAFVAAGIECRVVADVRRARWQKLVWNIPFNGLCALLDQSVDSLLRFPATRRLIHEIMREVIGAANVQGLSEPIADAFAEQMLTFTDAMGPYLPSMQIDRREGRPLELDAIFAAAVSAGAERGAALPRTSTIHALLSFAVDDGASADAVLLPKKEA